MAIQKIEKDGYGQIELNHVAWRRDGRIEAQCMLDATEFGNNEPAENGMLFAVNNTTRTLHKATPADVTANLPIGINYATELIYDERTSGLKNFYLTRDESLPRIGYFSIGDIFTTNTVAYDDAEFADMEALTTALENITTTPVYAGLNADGQGYMVLSATKPTSGPILAVVENTTMPDGQVAVKLQVLAV